MKPFIRTPYNYDMSAASNATATVNSEDSLTDQSAKNDADLNVLIRRFGVTGVISGVQRPPLPEQFADVFDFQGAMNLIRAAEESFAEVPDHVRKRFNYDPAAFVDFCGQEENLPEMRKMGLAVPEKPPIVEPPPQKVEIVNPAPSKPTGST